MSGSSIKRRWGIVAIVASAVVLGVAGTAEPDGWVAVLRAEIAPAADTPTSYGIPLSLESLPAFIGWWTTRVPVAEADSRYAEALSALVAPCCDDNAALRCCCETEEGQACNLIRSGKGLAAHLIVDLGYTADQVREAVLQWFQFVRWDYYVATEIAAQGRDPQDYGLTTHGSCYRGLCNTPISQGGCGGMQALIEPAIED